MPEQIMEQLPEWGRVAVWLLLSVEVVLVALTVWFLKRYVDQQDHALHEMKAQSSKIKEELGEIHGTVGKISLMLEHTTTQAAELEGKFEKLNDQVRTLSEDMVRNSEIVKSTRDEMKAQSAAIGGLESRVSHLRVVGPGKHKKRSNDGRFVR